MNTPMPIEYLRPDLLRIIVPSPTIPPATTTNAWVTDAKDGLVVDPAAHTTETKNTLLKTLAPFQPQAIFLTHHHRDHIGAATFLREQLQVPIFAHAETASLIDFTVDKQIDDGTTFSMRNDTWTAIHTPGHAPGHLCLLSSQDNSFIAGDMVAGEGTILIHPNEGSIREYIDSLEKIRTLNPSRLLPAHGQSLTQPEQTLQEYITHRKQRVLQIWDCLTDQPKTAFSIAKSIYTELPSKYIPMAAIQVTCGLLYLQEDGVVKEQSHGWIRIANDYSMTT